MSKIIENSLNIEKLIQKVITINAPSRDDICLSPYESIDYAINRICCDGYRELGRIDDFRRDYLDKMKNKKLDELLESNWNFDDMYTELKSIINSHLELKS